jgi:hypothetical protein
MGIPSRIITGVTRRRRNTQDRSNVYFQLSGLEDVVFNGFIKDDFIQEGELGDRDTETRKREQ